MLDLSKGTRLAERYTLERSLGSGGEATTWLAKDRLTRAQVALKIVPANSGANARLHDEWQTNLRLMHAHIVRVFEFHEDQGAAFYSMQFVDGADFGVLTGSPLADLLPPVGLVAEALRYAHGKNIVHRDIKASNVLLDFNGAPYLSDFGVAAPVGSLAAGGSPIAASPGALRGEAVQPADDIFALGKLIYELISGAPPQAKSDAVGGPEYQTLIAASGEDVPAAIRDLVASMLEAGGSAITNYRKACCFRRTNRECSRCQAIADARSRSDRYGACGIRWDQPANTGYWLGSPRRRASWRRFSASRGDR
jgi:serine/threonine protein kinase